MGETSVLATASPRHIRASRGLVQDLDSRTGSIRRRGGDADSAVVVTSPDTKSPKPFVAPSRAPQPVALAS